MTEEYKVIRGNAVGFVMSSKFQLSETDHEALRVLDRECEGGPGGTWNIVRKDDRLVAHPNGPFESIVFVDNRWIDLCDLEELEEIDE